VETIVPDVKFSSVAPVSVQVKRHIGPPVAPTLPYSLLLFPRPAIETVRGVPPFQGPEEGVTLRGRGKGARVIEEGRGDHSTPPLRETESRAGVGGG
jgi:hypothetical protein